MTGEIVAIVPAYNEERTIGDVVSRALKYVDRVIVVNDGSTDRTAEVAYQNGAVVLNQENMGVGCATRRGIVSAIDNYPDLFAVVLMDGDGQHDPDDLGNMMSAALSGSDLVIGRRTLTLKYMPFWRWFANWTFYVMRNIFTRRVIVDAECGYRIFTRRALDEIEITIDHFGFCEEVAIKARALGLTITEVPIKTIYGEEQTKYPFYSKVWHGVGIVGSLLKWRWIYEWRPIFGLPRQSNTFGRRTRPASPETSTHLK